ncbi:hypothetical protein OROHE_015825 [Orobanche hederae]
MKFTNQYEGQIIPECKAAFVDYCRLKKHLKKIGFITNNKQSSFTHKVFSSLRKHTLSIVRRKLAPSETEGNMYETELLEQFADNDAAVEFFACLDNELNKYQVKILIEVENVLKQKCSKSPSSEDDSSSDTVSRKKAEQETKNKEKAGQGPDDTQEAEQMRDETEDVDDARKETNEIEHVEQEIMNEIDEASDATNILKHKCSKSPLQEDDSSSDTVSREEAEQETKNKEEAEQGPHDTEEAQQMRDETKEADEARQETNDIEYVEQEIINEIDEASDATNVLKQKCGKSPSQEDDSRLDTVSRDLKKEEAEQGLDDTEDDEQRRDEIEESGEARQEINNIEHAAINEIEQARDESEHPCICKAIKEVRQVILKLADEVEELFLKHFFNGDKRKVMTYLQPTQRRNSHPVIFFVDTVSREVEQETKNKEEAEQGPDDTEEAEQMCDETKEADKTRMIQA